MGNKNGLLSDLQLRRWLKDGEPLAKSDGDGLTFTVSSAGCATWVLRYRYGKRRHELTLGRYPDISLSEVRTMAAIKRVDVMKGVNPVAEKRKAKAVAAKDWTVRELIKGYKTKVLITLAKSTQVCYTRHLKRIENRLGPLGVRDVESSDIVALIDDSKPPGASRVSCMSRPSVCSRMPVASGKRLINANPCVGIMISALVGLDHRSASA